MFSSSEVNNNCSGLLLQPDGSSLGWIKIPCKFKFNASFVCTKLHNTSLDVIRDAIVSSHYETCKDGWILMKGYCYLVIKPYANELSAADGIRICSLHNSTLPVTRYYYDKHIMSARQKNIYDALLSDYRQYILLQMIVGATNSESNDIPSTDWFAELEQYGQYFKPYGKYPIQRDLESTILELLDILYFYEPRSDWRNIAVWTFSYRTPCLYVEIPFLMLIKLVKSDDIIRQIRNPWLAEELECDNVKPVNYLICSASSQRVINKHDNCKGGDFLCQDGTCILSQYVRDGINDCTNGEDEHSLGHAHNNGTKLLFLANFYEYRCTSLDKGVTALSIRYHAICDGISQCPNNDDEQPCWTKELDQYYSLTTQVSKEIIPCAIGNQSMIICQFDRNSIQRSGDCRSIEYLSQCENVGCSRKFKCHNSYCISVDKLCDGIVDCLGGDDEISCEDYVCVGMLRCRGERICVGTWQICDGVPHCKTYDDEVNCEPCPDNCHCSGHVIICDVYSTDWTLNVNDTCKVIILKGVVTDISFMRLYRRAKMLDISNCNITYLTERKKIVTKFGSILYVYLNNNGLKSVYGFNNSIFINIFAMNISHNQIANLEGIDYQNLAILDVSYNALMYISEAMSLPVIEYINMEGNALLYIENSLLSIIPSLKLLDVSDYKICCALNLSMRCNYESTYLCPRMIEFYQKITLLCLAFLNFAAGILPFPLYRKQTRQRVRSHDLRKVICSNLSLSCIVVSIYITIIVTADTYYGQNYLHFYTSWLSSVACSISHVTSFTANASCSLLGCVKLLYILVNTVYPFKQLPGQLSLMCIMVWLLVIIFILPSSIGIHGLQNNLALFRFGLCLGSTQIGGHLVRIIPAALAVICQSMSYYVVYHLSKRSAKSSGHELSGKTKRKFVRAVLISSAPDLLFIFAYASGILVNHINFDILLYVFTLFPLVKVILACITDRKVR